MVDRSRTAIPIDLVVVTAICGFVTLITIQSAIPSAIRIPLGFAFVLIAPGYAIVSALFPSRGKDKKMADFFTDQSYEPVQITLVERLVLSLGLSLAAVPLLGLLLSFTQWGLDPTAMAVAVTLLTAAAATIATVRRLALPADQRFMIPMVSAPASFAEFIGESRSHREETLAVVIILGLMFSTLGIGYAATVPGSGEEFTEFYIQAPGSDSGEFEPEAYPSEWAVAELVEVAVGVGNQEGETVSYTIVVQQQQLRPTTSGYEVTATTELERLEVTADDGETRREELDLTPTESSDNARIAFLLYTGELPDEITSETAYRTVYLAGGEDTDEV